jgi:hypothetical protein
LIRRYGLLALLCLVVIGGARWLWLMKPAAAFDSDAQAATDEIRLVPQDDGSRDSTFDAFRKRLRQAASDRDSSYLESVLDPQVHVSFGPEERGLAAFRSVWRPHDPNSELWPKLRATLALAASRENDSFWIPYVYARWPAEFDPHAYAAVGDNDLLRDRPRPDGAVVSRLSYQIVRLLGNVADGGDWQRVATLKGAEGYLPSSSLLRPSGLRLRCVNSSSRWRIAVLLEGD